jgi:rhodanese-related sulfurtransferase
MDGLRVSSTEVKEALDRGETMVFLDVRSPGAWAESGHQLPAAVRLPLTDFEAHADELPKGSEIVAYCT